MSALIKAAAAAALLALLGCGGGTVEEAATPSSSETALPEDTTRSEVDRAAVDLCAGVVCTAKDDCHETQTCNPANGRCVGGGAKPNGTTCNDANACTLNDVCTAGVCGGAAVTCGAIDQCHDTGTCDPATGVCSTPAKPDGAACSDGDACSQTDTCQTGQCVGANPVSCTALDQCHAPGTCDPASGTCSNPPVLDGTACDDGNACSQTDTCEVGVCSGANPVICQSAGQCFLTGTCDPATGTCDNPLAPEQTPCNDSDACTQTDACSLGQCVGSNPVTCAALGQCYVAGTCDPATGTCDNPYAQEGTACSDDDSCTQTDACSQGQCVGSDPVLCTAQDQCHAAGTCLPGTGTCTNPALDDGTACSDDDACSVGDTCTEGVCTPGTPVSCTASDQCHLAGTCDSRTGLCSDPEAEDGTACSDGNACSSGDTCQGGTCQAASPVVCSAPDQCHTLGECDPQTGICPVMEVADGTPCSDSDACTQYDVCMQGQCTAGTAVTCAPAGPCRGASSCDPQTGVCSNADYADGTACNDGDACSTVDACSSGLCQGSMPVVCADTDACHVGYCDPTTGGCVTYQVPNDTPCNDGNSCTEDDVCRYGQCGGNPPPGYGPTRTLGFFKTHPDALEACLDQGALELGPLSISSLEEALGVLWASPAKYDDDAKRSEFDRATLLLGRQFLVAQCNVRLFGATPPDGLFDDASAALGGNHCSEILSLEGLMDAFNRSQDSALLPAGFDPGAATPTAAKELAVDPTSATTTECSTGTP